jgi:signal transduction histidine kinase
MSNMIAVLFITLSIEAMLLLQYQAGQIWLVVFMMLTTGTLLYTQGWKGSLPFIFLYGAGFYFFGAFANVLKELQRAHVQLQEYADQVEDLVIARERNRLAREMHDSITQDLYGITMYAEATERNLSSKDDVKSREYLQAIKGVAQNALGEMRLLIFELQPSTVGEEGLVGALQLRIDSVEKRAGLDAVIETQGSYQLTLEVQEGLYRVSKEALSNVLKHSRASHLAIKLAVSDIALKLEITDDGIGFDLTKARNIETFGLKSMEERVRLLGGALSIQSAPGKGTKVTVELNLCCKQSES